MNSAHNQPVVGPMSFDDGTINFPTGKLPLKTLKGIFDVLPFEFDFVDADNQFVWYSDNGHRQARREPSQVGHPVSNCHPAQAVDKVMAVLNALKQGKVDKLVMPYQKNGHTNYNVYYEVRDDDANYLGCLELTIDPAVFDLDAATSMAQIKNLFA